MQRPLALLGRRGLHLPLQEATKATARYRSKFLRQLAQGLNGLH
jgi:hypothetical protein